MITSLSALACGIILMLAGVLELWRTAKEDRHFLWAARLAALGFFMLGSRYLYLVATDDLLRLHFVGTASIAAIAVGRILSCVQAIRLRL